MIKLIKARATIVDVNKAVIFCVSNCLSLDEYILTPLQSHNKGGTRKHSQKLYIYAQGLIQGLQSNNINNEKVQ